MKNILFPLLLLVSFNCFCQLGNSYDFVLNEVKSKNCEYKLKKTDRYYYLTTNEEPDIYKAIYYYFNYVDNICFSVYFEFPISSINTIIQFTNGRFIKEGDLLWKDYEKDVYYEIIKDDENETAYLKKYRNN